VPALCVCSTCCARSSKRSSRAPSTTPCERAVRGGRPRAALAVIRVELQQPPVQ
jgi:hypothetical protein